MRHPTHLRLVLTLLPLLLTACADTPAPPPPPPEPAVSAGTVLAESETFGSPVDLALAGPYLVVLDGLGESAIHVVRRKDGRVAASGGRKGGGPGEYRGARALQAESETSVWVYDIELKRLTRLDIGRLAGDTLPAPAEIVTFASGELPMSPLWVSGALVSPGLFDAGRLGWFDREGRLLRTTGALPRTERDVPPRVLQHAYTGELAVRPDGSRIALGTRHADRLEIFDGAGAPLHVARGKTPFEPVFQVATVQGQPYMTSGEDLRFGYVDVAATDGAVYALFSGRTRGEAPGVAAFGRTVRVYGWDGRLRRTMTLDADVIGIAVDEAAGRLYAVRHEPTPAVLAYPLPPGDG